MSILEEGVQLERVISLPNGNEGCTIYKLGKHSFECTEIVVIMENGQMAGVPWAKCTTNTGEVKLINLANAEAVRLLDESLTT